MSRIGKQPVEIPSGVTVEIQGSVITVKGPKGELKKEMHPMIKIEVQDNQVIATRPDESKESRSLHGLVRSLVNNMVIGVSKGFEKKLEIVGVGYRAQPAKNKITLSLGYSHPVEYIAPEGIEFLQDEEAKNTIIVRGIDKQTVGEAAAKVRSYRKPEPYKGKGIKYQGEHIQRKAGKSAAK
ncbi:50S ribosomal protein L6 [Candidatus Peregrinibacteria bacterium]|nr:50S ribosomal protein L6 [Candidatus Peregrinibacteria bacterium]